MDRDKALREHLLWLLKGGDAHLDFEKAFAGLPENLRGAAYYEMYATDQALIVRGFSEIVALRLNN